MEYVCDDKKQVIVWGKNTTARLGGGVFYNCL